MAITRRTWLGMGREATPGKPADTPTFFIPLSGSIKTDRKPEYSTEERGTRDTNWNVAYTTRKASADFKGKYYNDSCPYILLGAFGKDTVTPATAPTPPTSPQVTKK